MEVLWCYGSPSASVCLLLVHSPWSLEHMIYRGHVSRGSAPTLFPHLPLCLFPAPLHYWPSGILSHVSKCYPLEVHIVQFSWWGTCSFICFTLTLARWLCQLHHSKLTFYILDPHCLQSPIIAGEQLPSWPFVNSSGLQFHVCLRSSVFGILPMVRVQLWISYLLCLGFLGFLDFCGFKVFFFLAFFFYYSNEFITSVIV